MSSAGANDARVTIFDVAREAQVSTATVSRVANGHTNIRPETRQKVEQAMARLGYVANLRARGLAGGKTNVIGLLVDDLESSYITQIVQGIDQAASGKGYDVMLSTMHIRQSRPLYIEQLFNGLVDGLIVLLVSGFEPYLDKVAERGFPVVLIDHIATGTVPVVKSANETGTRQAMDHLLGLGHRRIGIITGFLDVASARERLDGYRDSLSSAGIAEDDQLIVEGDFLPGGGEAGMRTLLELRRPPTAVVCSGDMVAFGAMQAAREQGLRIPEDMSIVGFDDIPEAAYVTPPLTTVRQPLVDMGRMSAELLLDLVGGTEMPASTIELPTELVIRDSTGPAPSQ